MVNEQALAMVQAGKMTISEFLALHEARSVELISEITIDSSFGSAARIRGNDGQLVKSGLIDELRIEVDFTNAATVGGTTGTIQSDADELAIENLKLRYKNKLAGQRKDIINGEPALMNVIAQTVKGISSPTEGNFVFRNAAAYKILAGLASTFELDVQFRTLDDLLSNGHDRTGISGATFRVTADVYDFPEDVLAVLMQAGINKHLIRSTENIPDLTAGQEKKIKHDDEKVIKREAFIQYNQGSAPVTRTAVDQLDQAVLEASNVDIETILIDDFRNKYERLTRVVPPAGLIIRDYAGLPYETKASLWKLACVAAFTGTVAIYYYLEEIDNF